jgi:hypothetical protein
MVKINIIAFMLNTLKFMLPFRVTQTPSRPLRLRIAALKV